MAAKKTTKTAKKTKSTVKTDAARAIREAKAEKKSAKAAPVGDAPKKRGRPAKVTVTDKPAKKTAKRVSKKGAESAS